MNQVECSICEFVFHADAVIGAEVLCPYCSKTFVLNAAHILDQESQKNTNPPAPPLLDEASTDEIDVSSADADARVQRMERLAFRRRMRFLATALLLLLSIGTAIVLYQRLELNAIATERADGGAVDLRLLDDPLNRDKAKGAKTNGAKTNGAKTEGEKALEGLRGLADDAADPAADTPEGSSQSELASTLPQSKPVPQIIPEPIPKPKFLYIERKTARLLWERVYPQLLLLEIESPAGRTNAVGVIIDSRGYVATSLSAIENAWAIKANTTSRTLSSTARKSDTFRDDVRGVIAKSPEFGLAILSVNRRFVISLDEIKMAAEDRVVTKKPLIRLVPPTPQTQWPFSELRIRKKRKRSRLPQENQIHIAQFHPGFGDHDWLRCDRSPIDLPGTPLFTEDGALVAMLASFNSENSFYVSTVPLLQMRERASGDLSPLSQRP